MLILVPEQLYFVHLWSLASGSWQILHFLTFREKIKIFLLLIKYYFDIVYVSICISISVQQSSNLKPLCIVNALYTDFLEKTNAAQFPLFYFLNLVKSLDRWLWHLLYGRGLVAKCGALANLYCESVKIREAKLQNTNDSWFSLRTVKKRKKSSYKEIQSDRVQSQIWLTATS